MSTPILATKLYIPPPRPQLVPRPRLMARLDDGLRRKLTLISAPAGFGKTTLVGAWLAGCQRPAAWLSLDAGDNDPARFLTYLIAALQTVAATIGQGVVGALHSPQPPPVDMVLTTLLNDLTTSLADPCVLVLDDYHVIDAHAVDHALTYLVEHLPPQLHLVLATREDPPLPLARLRAGSHLSELRAADLRFTPSEAAEFLNQAMGLTLSPEDVAALEARTEGWIAGLQLAAISLQGHDDTTRFIAAFTGSHHFVMDYLVEEVLQRQPDQVQTFLLRTAILDRLCGPLCDAVVLDPAAGSGQATLQYLDRANLFLVPLDDERRWYRYHHLFAELLRQRLQQSFGSSPGEAQSRLNELHVRASRWYEDQGLEVEAFQHAAAAQDIERAERLLEGKGIPLHLRGAVTTILDWLGSLPKTVLDARPSLWVKYGSILLVNGHTTGVEEKLQAGEAALQGREEDDKTRNLLGHIATARATLALTRYQVEPMLAQSRRALELLAPNNLARRANAHFTLGFAYFLQGDRAASRQAYSEGIALSQAAGDIFTGILATLGLGNVQEVDTQLFQAADTYRRLLQVAGDQPLQIVGEAHAGLAHVLYEWNDLDAAEQHGQQSLRLELQYESVIDRFVACEVFLARLKLARADVAGAAALLAEAAQSARERNFAYRIPEVAAAQVLVLLRQSNLAAAAQLAGAYDLPLSQARVHLAQGNPSAALALLEPRRRHVEAKGWADERLKVLVLEALALQAQCDEDEAMRALGDALALAAPGGCIRSFVDEGLPMARLLSAAAARGMMPDYIERLLAAFDTEPQPAADISNRPVAAPAAPAQPLIEPLSPREIEVLRLIAQGLSNQEIGERLYLALDTVKGHNRKIFDKLQVQRRTEAVARARALGLL
jgi:LuxR family transcriptional regulator, maltose regulon positive regulatory protein